MKWGRRWWMLEVHAKAEGTEIMKLPVFVKFACAIREDGVRYILVVGLALFCRIGYAGEPKVGAKLGADDFHPSPEHPVGFLGDCSGRYAGAHDFPLEWDSTTGKNILWKTELPNWGHSSPIVVGKRVFLTCEADLTVCLDAETGTILWQKKGNGYNYNDPTGAYHGSGTYSFSTGWSMGTACSDGKSLYVTHYNGVVVSYEFSGKVRWRKEVPPHGWTGASPVLIDGKFVVVQGGGCKLKPPRGGPRELVAYSCEDGAVVWRNPKIFMGGWNCRGYSPIWVEGTPYLVDCQGQFFNARDGRVVATLFSSERIPGYSPHNGMLWVPAVEGDTVVFSEKLSKHVDWRLGMQDLAKVNLPIPVGLEEAKQRDNTLLLGKAPRATSKAYLGGVPDTLIVPLKVASDGKDGLRFEVREQLIIILGRFNDVGHGILDDGIMYHVGDGNHYKPGISVLDLKTGSVLSPGGYDGMEIKPSRPAPDGIFGGSSLLYTHPVKAGDYFMVNDWGGRTHVYNRAPDFRQVAENLTTPFKKPPSGNPIGGPAGGLETSLFHQGNRIYLRHFDVLYCIGDPKAAENAAAFSAAKAHADGGRIPQALQAYHQLWNAEPLHVRYRAIREMRTVLGSKALDELCQAFRHQDVNLRALAVRVAARIPDEAVARKLAEGLNDSDPVYRCQVLEALGQRGDRSVVTQLVAALDDKAAEVRLAAIGATRRIGGATVVQGVVSRLERFGEPERMAATEALIAMPEPDTEKSMAELVSQASPVSRSVLLRVLGRRGAVAQTALVLGEVGNVDRSVRFAALGSLAILAGIPELDPIVVRMKQAKDDEERRAIEGVLLSIFSRTQAADAYAAAVLRGLATVDGPGLASLIRVLGPAGGKASLAEVRKALTGKDAAVHAAAIEAMAAWPDTATESDLMAAAKTERDATNLAVVVSGLIRMMDMSPKRPTNEIFAIYAQALKTGQSLEFVVTHMAGQQDMRTIEMTAALLEENRELEKAIVTTITAVAPGVAEKDPSKTVTRLMEIVEEVEDPTRKDTMNATIKDLVRKYGSKTIEIPIDGGLDL